MAVPALVTARLQPREGLPGNSRWDSGLATMQLRPSLSVESSDFLSASGSQAVTHSLHFLQSRLFPFWTNF